MPMREYTCAPKSRPLRAYLYVLGAVLGATALWTVPSLFEMSYRPVWYFGALFLLTVALLVTVRYLLRRYVYRFKETESGGFDFVVWEISGKRTVCVCRVSVDSFRALTQEEKGKHPRPHYDWSAGPGGSAYLLTIRDGDEGFDREGEEIVIRFSPDRDMAAMIEYSLRSLW